MRSRIDIVRETVCPYLANLQSESSGHLPPVTVRAISPQERFCQSDYDHSEEGSKADAIPARYLELHY